ncbi:fructosamine kinase family protein [Companilactobacillus bobalius]|uniref:fructosamine kinase family protein n=1 Tax=Companilactobacillus bobalius TaxID=2801451 RepID=UPI001302C267|nr:fructosamine kinase family protein [Companilactobacillus bobalius]KAE9560258.1 aminoglycoside phosphotransferase [Companilactobacillus bobalius]
MLIDESWYKELDLGKIEEVQSFDRELVNSIVKIIADSGGYDHIKKPDNNESFFDHEVESLNLINSVANAPKVVRSGTFCDSGELILNYFLFSLANLLDYKHSVKKMHQRHSLRFGLGHDVLNAKNPKINTWRANWGDFYIQQRLNVLINEVQKKNLWNDERDKMMRLFEEKLIEYYQVHPIIPSLMHGDLWNGNVGFQQDQQPILFDPDVFFGNREMDIAMTLLFGGFNEEFYQGYQNLYPLDKDWQKRVPWYQTYYLLAHLNLFGETYGASFDNVLKQSVEN